MQIPCSEWQSWQKHVPDRLVLPYGQESHPSGRVSRWQIRGLQDIVNRPKAKHKGKHLLLKGETERQRDMETERNRGDTCAHTKRGNRRKVKMAMERSEVAWSGRGLPLKGTRPKE